MSNKFYIDIFLDDLRDTPEGFKRVNTVQECIDSIMSYQGQECGIWGSGAIRILSLDNDLGEGQPEGYKVMDWIEEKVFTDPNFICPLYFVIHSANPAAKKRMESVITRISDFNSKKKI